MRVVKLYKWLIPLDTMASSGYLTWEETGCYFENYPYPDRKNIKRLDHTLIELEIED